MLSLLGGQAGFEAHATRLAGREDAEATVRLAQGYGARGRLQEALRWAVKARERGAHSLRIHLVRGDAYLAAERFEFAIREYYEVVAQAPLNGYAQVRLWRCLRRADVLPDVLDAGRLRGELRKGGLYLPDAPSRPPDAVLARSLREAGEASLLEGRAREAVSKLHAALAQDDGDPLAYLALARAQEQVGEPLLAAGAYRLFLELAPTETRTTRDARRFLVGQERRRGRGRAR